jgi:hypothetical protein
MKGNKAGRMIKKQEVNRNKAQNKTNSIA